MSRLVRVLIYEGDEDALRKLVDVIQKGPVPLITVSEFHGYSIASVVAEAENIPCLFCDRLTNNTDLICDNCIESTKNYAEIINL